MADLVSEQPVPARPTEPELVARRRAQENVPRHRFGIAYLILAACVGAAVGLAVVAATRDDGSEKPGAAWSAWRPVATGTLGVREIARYIAPQYRLSNGGQLVSVVAGPMVVPSEGGLLPVSAILIRSGKAGVASERIDVDFPQAGVFYQMCGTGQQCAIPGTATAVRGQLVRREALELALYTFRYLPEADNVLVFLPPPQGVDANDPNFHRLVFLPRAALSSELSLPLKTSLPPGTTTMTPARLSSSQARVVDDVTAPRTFHYEFQQAADQSVFVVLSPLVS
ncbi:MAG TPA: hypothetical protein VJT84_14555 [Gaiellaceae bacterium]|nr:hypothetical protein [Gaiellaceae bacterium]